ncbi:MAG: hypothetical protein Faunusvirus62_3 [Faunusvirus sp.]|jgi:class 3 adenylate cyclase/PAS domain-containing protein|uniref:Guanylate cyclase domain-containing protein n=1 Tax=Faunusvirus sp. TaxID=2487766 RepID=A0A3G5A0R5_9VIRU|nr:MAG: hypothetical protein Faunusvirus62_3 [Faunusvirus sp.]
MGSGSSKVTSLSPKSYTSMESTKTFLSPRQLLIESSSIEEKLVAKSISATTMSKIETKNRELFRNMSHKYIKNDKHKSVSIEHFITDLVDINKNSYEGIILIDNGGKILFANSPVYKMMGYTNPDEVFNGKHINILIPPSIIDLQQIATKKVKKTSFSKKKSERKKLFVKRTVSVTPTVLSSSHSTGITKQPSIRHRKLGAHKRSKSKFYEIKECIITHKNGVDQLYFRIIINVIESDINEDIGYRININDITQLTKESMFNKQLIHSMFPEQVAKRVLNRETINDHHENITVGFFDMKHSTKKVKELSISQFTALSRCIINIIDQLIVDHDITKIERVGDSYFVACGLFGEANHAEKMLKFMCCVQSKIKQLSNNMMSEYKLPEFNIEYRYGVTCGPVVATIMDQSCYHYSLFGTTVHLGARLEHFGEVNKIHVTRSVLDNINRKLWNITPNIMCRLKDYEEVDTYFIGPVITPIDLSLVAN